MRTRSLCALSAALLMAACARHAPPAATPPKPVKIEVAGDSASQQADSFVGTLRARQRTDLSFETAGRLTLIKADVGDQVRAGQVLAQLDPAPARWRLDKAVAERDAAHATLAERQTWLHQQQALARDGVISPAALQAAQASHQLAASQQAAAEAALATARRDLELTRITAPFDGQVVARSAQPFVDVGQGQTILQLESGNALELVAQLPDAAIAHLKPGMAAQARSGNDRLAVKLERLSGRSDNGSLVQAIFRVEQAPAGIRSGAAVALELPRQGTPTLTLPASAIIAANDAKGASVYLVRDGSVQRRPVGTDGRLLPEGRVAITSGVSIGDQVVVAGTAFLSEGQAVVAHRSQTLLQGAQQ
ncbi:efflux RND transporter periplasmic adaptor subunit [Duganella vulcania]|uniref:Efflux RND transporter periplasmic adaptor subunit n=1 Tax=Duganella vulcania TaxID=2692166 RepID=A0A845GKE3_9BURK|nr:efflux RND transporter periplasmic adaptor subunit [Duganella vulcania]MYM93207.1 efflux RND transporter periplasmic adaptor subunit [Duganella vulcania]